MPNSPQVISGTSFHPSPLTQVGSLVQEITNAFDMAMSAASEELTELLRSQAEQHGWTEELTKSVNIGYAGSILDVNIDPTVEEEVFKLEYGTEDVPPTATIRKMHNHPRAHQIVKKHLDTHLPDAFNVAFERLL